MSLDALSSVSLVFLDARIPGPAGALDGFGIHGEFL